MDVILVLFYRMVRVIIMCNSIYAKNSIKFAIRIIKCEKALRKVMKMARHLERMFVRSLCQSEAYNWSVK